MSNEQTPTPVPTPWHLWAVGVLALLWSAMGAYDYLMTETRNEAYMSRFTPEQLEFFYGFPNWVVSLWAIAVWGGVLASIFLLLRKGFTAEIYLVSLVAMVITALWNYLFAGGLAVSGAFGLAFTVIIFVLSLLLYLYARAMRTKGVLR